MFLVSLQFSYREDCCCCRRRKPGGGCGRVTMLPPRVLSPCLCLIRFWSAVSGCVRCWIWGVSTNHLNFFWILLCSIYTSMLFISLSNRYLLFLYISRQYNLTQPQSPHVLHVQSLVPYLLRVSATAPQIGREQWARAQLLSFVKMKILSHCTHTDLLH